jgi:hypothetical protein
MLCKDVPCNKLISYKNHLYVRSDKDGGNGFSATIPSIFNGKVAFACIGEVINDIPTFYAIPMDTSNFDENLDGFYLVNLTLKRE